MYCYARKVLFFFKISSSFLQIPTWYPEKTGARALRISKLQDFAYFCLLLQFLLLRAVRSLLLMRSLTDATELYTGMELHVSAGCPNQAEL